MKIFIYLLAFTLVPLVSIAQHNPSFEEVISIPDAYNVQISPDGQNIVFQMRTTDWENNRFDSEIWLAKAGQKPFRLSNSQDESSYAPQWSPDGKWISFLSKRGKKTQIQILRAAGGEAYTLSQAEQDVQEYAWSPNGAQIAFVTAEDQSKDQDAREELYGKFSLEDQEYGLSELWLMDFKAEEIGKMPLPEQMRDSNYVDWRKGKRILEDTLVSINTIMWSPQGDKLAIEHQPDPLINSFFKADISILDLKASTVKTLVDNPSYDGLLAWSPEGTSILYNTDLADTTSNYYKNNHYFKINVDGSGNQELAKDFDENLYRVRWNTQGIFALARQKTERVFVRLDPNSGAVSIVSKSPRYWDSFSFSKDAQKIAFIANTAQDLPELYESTYPLQSPQKLSNFSQYIQNWKISQSEVITWKSEDGASIEGVLHKPQDYEPQKKYPLLVVIHGGPASVSVPNPCPAYVYPILQWLNKGALVLQPNYRGSAGYGEAFRSLNVKNLGLGDAWDVLSGVQYLEDQGMIDGNLLGAMGWSQGGYISAFLTTHSDKFQAISVGAGISNWMTYYVNTDVHPFTRQYLKATPWSDKAIYEKTSPMSQIQKASTPTLIQHGEYDRRVPIANAYELYQGLQDQGVPSRLIVYKGFGHGITKPKERLAAMWHNWQWFGKYLWEEEIALPTE